MFLTLLLAAPILAQNEPPLAPASPKSDWSAHVLTQGETTYTVADVFRVAFASDDPLAQAYRDPNTAELFRLYINSPRFYEIVREFSDWLAVFEDSEHEPAQGTMREQLDRVLEADQPTDFTMPELRAHYLKSVPEFHGQLPCSWIRVPLIDLKTGFALSQDARNGLHQTLTQVGDRIMAKTLTWEEAVLTYSQDPISRKRNGAAGILSRQSTKNFEVSMLKQLFANLGFKRKSDGFLRGPIFGEKWVYLIQVEALHIFGTGDITQVADEIELSLRESMREQELRNFTRKVTRKILLPIQSKKS